jgi:hypothetical protein
MPAAGAPTLADLKAWLGLEVADTYDDVVLTESLNAALAGLDMVVDYPIVGAGVATFTDDLRNAVFLQSQRLAARRNSPEGVVGLSGIGGDFVSARVPPYDADVLRQVGPYLKIPVA